MAATRSDTYCFSRGWCQSEVSGVLLSTPKQPDLLVVREFSVQPSAWLLRQVSPQGMFPGYLPSHQAAACGALTGATPSFSISTQISGATMLVRQLLGLDWLLPSSARLQVSVPREPE